MQSTVKRSRSERQKGALVEPKSILCQLEHGMGRGVARLRLEKYQAEIMRDLKNEFVLYPVGKVSH